MLDMDTKTMTSLINKILLLLFIGIAFPCVASDDFYQNSKFMADALPENAEEQFLLGARYYVGSDVDQDYKEAEKLFRLAAVQGYAMAQAYLGLMYAEGKGVPQDYKEAVKWYRLAAEQGNAETLITLAVMYGTGVGVPESTVIAYALINLSASIKPNEKLAFFRNNLLKLMSKSEVEAGQTLTREMSKPNNFLLALDKYTKSISVKKTVRPNKSANPKKR